MSGYVWRLVVDKWPTENGEPFASQGFEYWETVVNAFRLGESIPDWLPADFGDWVTPTAAEVENDVFAVAIPDRVGYSIEWSDAPDYVTGYGGDGEHLMNVPHTNGRRRFSKHPVANRLADLLAWGCEAHIERAPIGEWETA
ncbi:MULTISPECIES: SPRY domain-containing protein [Nocardia]|uniref:hypothetical protein n=1 Tax=Nocardia TaxID=1817 RepID=UPI000D688940|nr:MULTISPECIES: hypothetical protein [Nocardia]